MPANPFRHPFRIDAPTLRKAGLRPGGANLARIQEVPEDVRYLTINPAAFTHAYLLLGQSPLRFTTHLNYYLAGVNCFFDSTSATGCLEIPPEANTDIRRRLSEDLGVGLAAQFMVDVFGLGWDTITQIPNNAALSKKRPDFIGFTSDGQRYIFEAKGTTQFSGIEKAMSKAIGQVKSYPVGADSKFAIVSYLSADRRFFPSTSFVVDPPALPAIVKLDLETARLLHFEKSLQFVGMEELAVRYIVKLRNELSEKRRLEAAPDRIEYFREDRGAQEMQKRIEIDKGAAAKERIDGITYLGRTIRTSFPGDVHAQAFLGITPEAIDAGMKITASEKNGVTKVVESEERIVSTFTDGTVLRVSWGRRLT